MIRLISGSRINGFLTIDRLGQVLLSRNPLRTGVITLLIPANLINIEALMYYCSPRFLLIDYVED